MLEYSVFENSVSCTFLDTSENFKNFIEQIQIQIHCSSMLISKKLNTSRNYFASIYFKCKTENRKQNQSTLFGITRAFLIKQI